MSAHPDKDDPMSSTAATPTIQNTRMGRLARTCYQRRRRVLLVWGLLLVVVFGFSGALKGKFSNKFTGGHSQAQLAQNLLTEKFPVRSGDSADAVFDVSGDVHSPANQAAIAAFDQQLMGIPHVLGVRSPFDTGGANQISPTDAHIAYSVIQFDKITQDV